MKYTKICEYCGATFVAQKQSTKFCSKGCASRDRKVRLRKERFAVIEEKKRQKAEENSRQERDSFGEMLSPTLASKYLGVHRATLYRYIASGQIGSIKCGGRTLVKRSDIDAFMKGGYRLSPSLAVDGYMTVSDVASTYGLSYSGSYKILRESGLRKSVRNRTDYYNKHKVELLFEQRARDAHPGITEWYSRKEVMEKYNMTDHAVSTMITQYHIPWKKNQNVHYYSKAHIDAIMRDAPTPSLDEYYSVKDAMARYGMTRDMIYFYLKQYHIRRFQVGRFVYFTRKEFDAIFAAADFDL